MQNDRKQVLQLLAEGKINAEDAERLLERLAQAATAEASSPVRSATGKELKFMRVHVDSHEGDTVDIRLPIALLRAGVKLSALMPKEAAEAMSKNGVDFSQLGGLSGEALTLALQDLSIDVSSHEGDQVTICCE